MMYIEIGGKYKREELPQIPNDKIEEFLDFCKNVRGKQVWSATPKFYKGIKPSQDKVLRKKVALKRLKIEQHRQTRPHKIFITTRNLELLDGHHTWYSWDHKLSDSFMDYTVECCGVDCSIEELIQLGHDFNLLGE